MRANRTKSLLLPVWFSVSDLQLFQRKGVEGKEREVERTRWWGEGRERKIIDKEQAPQTRKTSPSVPPS